MTTDAPAPERHLHEAKCWARYEPCGEHHAHSWWCGGGDLSPECPEYERDLLWRIDRLVREGLPAIQEAAEVRAKLGKPTPFDELFGAAAKFKKIWRRRR